jgi:CheY-like chemotaxis protein
MENGDMYPLLREIIAGFASRDPSYQPLPEAPDEDAALNDLGLDITTLPEIIAELQARLGGRDLKLDDILTPADVNTMTMKDLLHEIRASLAPRKPNPQVVYVDDEEENLFVFARKFGKKLNLKTFTDPVAALAYIKSEDSVSLVITDEVMPHLSGNELCDEVHKAKPMMKFVLITGNPNHEDDLLYRTLRKNRFYEFINKPIDLERKGDEYMRMFQNLLSSEL